MFKKNETI